MGEIISLWEIVRGYSCRKCNDVARADPNDGERWGCKTCDKASKDLLADFARDADERERLKEFKAAASRQDYLKQKYPTSNFPPKPDCKFCGGTGERSLRSGRKVACICLFVEHSAAEEVLETMSDLARRDTKRNELIAILNDLDENGTPKRKLPNCPNCNEDELGVIHADLVLCYRCGWKIESDKR